MTVRTDRQSYIFRTTLAAHAHPVRCGLGSVLALREFIVKFEVPTMINVSHVAINLLSGKTLQYSLQEDSSKNYFLWQYGYVLLN